LNVLNHRILERADITPAKLDPRSGRAAREYVVAAWLAIS
jgi:hypothetical protein